MARSVLVPVDDSRPAWNALRHAISAFPDASFTVLHVLDPANYHTYGGDAGVAYSGGEVIGRRRREQASKLLAEAVELVEKEDREVTAETKEGDPATVIVTCAKEQEIDQIVIGSHGRSGIKRLLLGSVAEAVVRRSPVPVTVVRDF